MKRSAMLPLRELLRGGPAGRRGDGAVLLSGVEPGAMAEPQVVLLRRQAPLAPGEVVTVGRDPGCDVVLDGPGAEGLAEQHASFVVGVTLDQWYVMDEGSPAGTTVEGARLRPGRLTPLGEGDEVRLGDGPVRRFFTAAGLRAYVEFRRRLARPGAA